MSLNGNSVLHQRAQTSKRVQATDAPVIGKTKALIAGVQGVQSLAQGELLEDAAQLTGLVQSASTGRFARACSR